MSCVTHGISGAPLGLGLFICQMGTFCIQQAQVTDLTKPKMTLQAIATRGQQRLVLQAPQSCGAVKASQSVTQQMLRVLHLQNPNGDGGCGDRNVVHLRGRSEPTTTVYQGFEVGQGSRQLIPNQTAAPQNSS